MFLFHFFFCLFSRTQLLLSSYFFVALIFVVSRRLISLYHPLIYCSCCGGGLIPKVIHLCVVFLLFSDKLLLQVSRDISDFPLLALDFT